MKTFTYKWKINNNEIIGTRDFENEDELKSHVSKHGTLIEIIKVEEKPSFISSPINHQQNPVNQEYITEREINNFKNGVKGILTISIVLSFCLPFLLPVTLIFIIQSLVYLNNPVKYYKKVIKKVT